MFNFIFIYINNLILSAKESNEEGFTLLEYAAGATVILVTLWGLLNGVFAKSFTDLFDAIGDWLKNRATDITNAS